MDKSIGQVVLSVGLAVVCVVVLGAWWNMGPSIEIERREPVVRDRAVASGDERSIHDGWFIAGPGEPGTHTGHWPQFRGPGRDNVAVDSVRLSREWGAGGPRVLWALDVGEGYAGPAVVDGRVYLLDYDAEAEGDVLRCLSLDDGREIWRQGYPVRTKRNHGMSRTVPAVAEGYVVTMGPKNHVLCVDAITGEKKWIMDLTEAFGAVVPPWYAGQCPLIDDGRAIIAPGGDDVLMIAVALETGEVMWQTPNPARWAKSHASVMPMTLADGRRTYVYVAAGGVAGVDAATGELLWHTDAWRIRVATVPSAVPIDGERIFLAGGYNAGAMMLRVTRGDNGYTTEPLWELHARQFGSAQHTPIFHDGHLFGVRPDRQLVCLDLDGQVVWTSGPAATFGIGPYLIADGLIVLLDDDGKLTLAEATTTGYQPVATAQVLDGHEAWAPMALADGWLLLRDLTRMACIDLRAGGPGRN